MFEDINGTWWHPTSNSPNFRGILSKRFVVCFQVSALPCVSTCVLGVFSGHHSYTTCCYQCGFVFWLQSNSSVQVPILSERLREIVVQLFNRTESKICFSYLKRLSEGPYHCAGASRWGYAELFLWSRGRGGSGVAYPNFERSILGCIEASFCNMCVISLRLARFCSVPGSNLGSCSCLFHLNYVFDCKDSLEFYQNRYSVIFRKLHRMFPGLQEIPYNSRKSVYFADISRGSRQNSRYVSNLDGKKGTF